ncbi:HAMP domain-containing sensor histidine kinase [Microbaculum marinum]|uniref:histidine kinase n=1 Tax=Microbaculum marinum TaxID=1764581 RepID=A0AAW9RRS8_9HYPH
MARQGDKNARSDLAPLAAEDERFAAEDGGARAQPLTPAGTRSAIEQEMLGAYASNQTALVLLVPLLAIIIAAMLSVWVSWTHAAIWLAAILIGNGLLTHLCRRYLDADGGLPRAAVWQRRFVAAEFVNGLLWSAPAFLGAAPGGQVPTIFLFAILIVALSIRTLTASNLPSANLAGTVPITAAIVLTFGMLGGPMHLAMAGLAIGAQVFFMIVARQLRAGAPEMIGLRAEKDALIGELEQARAQSEEARRRAEEASLAKSRFLATMSHELRTPLNAILGFSEVLKDEMLGAHTVAAYKEYSADIHRSGRHLLNLIDEILDLSRIEADRYELREEAVALVDTVEDCRRLLRLHAHRRGITLKADFETDLPAIRGDQRAVRQIVLNLLTNAIKFSPDGSAIDLMVGWTTSGGQYLSVTDSGPGIPEEEIPTVLQAFGRGTLAVRNAEEGSGLGLPIVVKLVELHGGRFDLHSRLHQGTEVIVTFPRERVTAARPPQQDNLRRGAARRHGGRAA